ncbi:MAG: peptide chain release factor N(5)-glutamine methyltransferase [Hyphomicrobiales bacterium]
MPPDAPLDAVVASLRKRFAAAGLDTPALDARLLAMHALGATHADIVAGLKAVPEAGQATLEALARRRLAGETVSRIVGEREFYGRPFRVTGDTLDPRPDTETLIEAVATLFAETPPRRLLDLGTGTGILAVTLLCVFPSATGVATDVSVRALEVAKANAVRHGVQDRLALVEANWFDGVDGMFDLIVSNPPYIATGEIAGLDREVRDGDPRLALDGGTDGLLAYRAIARGAGRHLAPGGYEALEIGSGQAAAVEAIFAAEGYIPAPGIPCPLKDLAGRDRVQVFCRS